MIIKNARLQNGIFDIEIKDGKISDIGNFDKEGDINAEGKRAIPGLIDTHIHGYAGVDTSDGNLSVISRALALDGTTSFFPTTMTDSVENLIKTTNQPLPESGANVVGYHLEGPYISTKKKGAQNEAFIKSPDLDEFKKFNNVSVISLAPELDGAIEFIENCACRVSIGHTDCDCETAIKAIEAGADGLTHTFNAMPPLLHRAPGPIGAAAEKEIYTELICDGRHVSKAAVLALYKMMGSDKVILISDAIRPAGLPNGRYDSGGLTVIMNDGALTLEDGTLAGGSQPLLQCVKTAVSFGIDFYEAVKMASETPAKRFNLNKGKIEKGYDADIVIINDNFSVSDVIIGGKLYK
ncbi:MAG: N-acetylglucosamine-6-phosphate deacetylase [Clostridia bacterium]|nr:N-acetylglucosamine-6-phosphate deacetylase [Clostridia bacterium]